MLELILNRFQNAVRLQELEQPEPQQRERDGNTADHGDSDQHEEAVNQRMRDFAAFERRAKGKDVA